MMRLRPLLIDEDPAQSLFNNSFCRSLFISYPAYYHTTGYAPPWIAYFVMKEDEVVGCAGFTGAPAGNRVEIAYGTAPEWEGRGVASFACQALIGIALGEDPGLIVVAKTAPEPNASNHILRRAGFLYSGVVQDEGIGAAWEWTLLRLPRAM